MNELKDVQEFLSQKTIAFAGLSRDPQSFSARVFQDLRAKGYRVLPVNPNAQSILGQTCYPNIAALPEAVGGVLLFTPPGQTEGVVHDAAKHGIRRVWIQQGAQSEAALAICREQDLTTVSRQCILMYAQPVGSLHKVHRWVKGLFGGLPR
jgi:predicted CoA-binding protein